jgi:Na+/H+ antiporter NhaD/arsenite permease-like protein
MLELAVFVLVYAGMFLGRIPRLQLDRTGVALLGAIALLAFGEVSLEAAARAVDLPTMALLFAFMVVSAQLRMGGFFGLLTLRLGGLALGPLGFLAGLVIVVGLLSAVFSNDIVCLAIAPLLIEICRRRGLAPVPYLLALACAANIGSAMTLIGNPQNILIGQALGLSFAGYLATATVPTLAGLAIVWGVIAWRGGLEAATSARAGDTGFLLRAPGEEPGPLPAARVAAPAAESFLGLAGAATGPAPGVDRWQMSKGLAVTLALLLIFLFTPLPREIAALAGAGLLLMSRKLHSRQMLGLVDWQLLVLFAGLFVVNAALQATGLVNQAVAGLSGWGITLADPGWLFVVTVALSNLVSNVPATMLLLPLADHALAGPILALASTLAGNLLIIGSIANIIVVGAAVQAGIRIGWVEHARVGVPVTVLSLALAAGWLAWV